MSKASRGIGPVPEGLPEGLTDFLSQLRRFSTDVASGRVGITSGGGSGGSGSGSVVIGGGGGGGDPYEPDLTPPPAPTGVVITGGFASVIFETDAPVFTQGHGHDVTIVYGKKYGGTGPLPTFSTDAKQREFGGNIDAMPSDLGTQWHFWVTWRSKDGVESSPAGGVNGVQVTIGKVGHSDLGPLIIEADNLADGTVTAAKIAANAVDLTKFANGIEPVTIVTGALPTTFVTTNIFWTDNKLYRWSGAAYTKAVDGADIVANSITAGQIAAGAIGAQQIAAGAITAGKLLVTGQGAALNYDPAFKDRTAWFGFHGAAVFATGLTDGAAGTTSFQSPVGIPSDVYSVAIPVDPSKSYRVRVQARRSVDANGTLYIGLRFWDGAGENITGNGTFWYVGAVNSLPGTSWTRYQGVIGQGGPIGDVPVNAKQMSVLALVNYGGSAGYMELQDLRVEEAIGADLIVDGAIVAGKLSAGAIAVGSAAIADGAIRNALIENLAVDNAKIASMSVAKLIAGSLSVGQYVQSANYVPGVSGWRIAADGFARFRGLLIDGDSYFDGQVTIRRPDGTVLLQSGGTLAASDITPSSGWLNSSMSQSGNLIWNSDQASAMTMDWAAQNGGAFDHTLQFAANLWVDTYTLRGGGLRNLTLHQSNIVGGGDSVPVADIYPLGPWSLPNSIAVAAGWTLCFSAYLASHRCRFGVGMQFFNAAGGLVSSVWPGEAGPTDASADDLALYSRQFALATVPVGAAYVRPFIRKFNTVAGHAESWMWIAAPMLEVVGPTASGPSAYSAGPATSTRQLGYSGDLNATLGATWGGTLTGRPSNLADLGGGETIRNDQISMGSGGEILGIGAGAGTVVSNNQMTLTSDGKLYSGATYLGQTSLGGLGAGAFATLNAITSLNVGTYIASTAIDYSRIGVLQASNLSVVALSDTINGGVTSTGRVQVTSNRIDVYDDANVRRVRLGQR
jgi:hypothetical protein